MQVKSPPSNLSETTNQIGELAITTMDESLETQECYLCGHTKPLSEFIQRIDTRYYNMCRDCSSRILLSARERGPRKKHQHTDTHRTCYLCERFLPVSEFTRRKNGTYFSGCKDCNRHVFAQRRRARLANSSGDYTLKEWQDLVAKYDRCPDCGRKWGDIPLLEGRSSPITADHIIPISAGGPNTIENIRPLCYSCNSRKGARLSPDDPGTVRYAPNED